MSGSIVITGARAPVALDLARACRAAGYDVHIADSAPSHAARALRPALPFHRLPPPRQQFAAFRQAILALLDATGAIMVVPTCEEIFWLAEAAQRDGWTDRLLAPDIGCLRTLHSKALFPAFAASLGVAVPPTVALDAAVDPARLPLPLADLVFKPEFSRFATHVHVSPTAEDVARLRPTTRHRWVAQQRVRGMEVCSWAMVHGGRVTAFAAYRPRWRQGRAAAFMVEAVDMPAVRAISEAIAAATGMTGHLSLDLIVDSDGQPWPIECNPRAVSGLHLFDADAALGHATIAGVACRDPAAGMLRHLGPAMPLLGVPAALLSGRMSAFRDDWRQSRDAIDREGQWRLTAGSIADAAGFAWQALRTRVSPAAGTTADIEWDGEAMP